METELGVPKPGDLLIGVVDFFAILVPGIIAAALIVKAVGVYVAHRRVVCFRPGNSRVGARGCLT